MKKKVCSYLQQGSTRYTARDSFEKDKRAKLSFYVMQQICPATAANRAAQSALCES